ncbi:riboflavin biosynthesis protein RibD [Vibrio sp. UCD-FRSSP16_10]|uniref:bifunctional diaminohydroxyphosphoribosylaminopyrimidine deaminase/5-amino-6-(5-phosphoribosylamino)uracil reductase RibD n=1 Tax=unclassified Vibrio TaxID=2614977 RepID=UPI0007FE3AA0|nr:MULTISPECIES: bifunctional diaminohydroxyphosphoribosylaminopyrimidine deaminase/5-amino-6-(5-phosphoribosylamino)uracil reductase RibD [unclassified Vibrio]OBT16842.1 riboflavin biosynthesis protein RibD [Vibrio sp. UCD-FRSSP16_30]OBT21829.1 riboflavin biosynthesis protein RibD [Vibrio sp. UCD-FRSSP16_10]
MSFSLFDHQMMAKAIKLAEKGRFTTHPNPNVGCVITQGESVVGHGYHIRAGGPHAEVHALRMAAEKSVGATAYVTLEPCSHYGRTPPCAEGLIKAGVSRVICAMQDPNPQVSGNGIAMLREAGIEVQVGLLESEAERINRPFLKKMRTGLPWVQLKMAASLDGKTALSNGKSQWITSGQARADVQLYRAQAGAILSTSKTMIDDNASLNVRFEELSDETQALYPEGEVRQPVRVILDRQRNLTQDLRLFNTSGEVLVMPEQQAQSASSKNSGVDLAELLVNLASQHNINHIWVEAGATLAASFIEQQLVDELIVYLAPKIMGTDGRGLVNLLGLTDMQQAVELQIEQLTQVGPDIKLVATFKSLQ